MTATVRTTALEVYVFDGVDWQYDGAAYAASCRFGFDQRYAEADIWRTGGSALAVNYWSRVDVWMGASDLGYSRRFSGYVVPLDNALYPVQGVLHCRGNLYRAEWVRNQEAFGTDLAGGTGAADEAMVMAVLDACGVPYDPDHIGGTGKALGSVYNGNPDDVFTPGPFYWTEGESGLAYLDRLDAVSVPDTADGRYRTFETLGGDVFRIPLATAPASTPDFSFTEGVDVLAATITRDPGGAANRVTVTGAPVAPASGIVHTFTATTGFAPYLPPGLPNAPGTATPADPDGFPVVGTAFASPLIEKSENADPGDVVSCEAVAQFLLQEHNCVLDTLEFATPRADLLGPGQTIHLHSPRLGITDPDQHYWLQRLEVSLDERGAFTQKLTCVRRS
jgi:hypothetical protein